MSNLVTRRTSFFRAYVFGFEPHADYPGRKLPQKGNFLNHSYKLKADFYEALALH